MLRNSPRRSSKFWCSISHRCSGEADSSINNPRASAPSALDFAFVIGMIFRVSDMAVPSPVIRRLALWHGITAFRLNVAILALTLNVLGSQI